VVGRTAELGFDRKETVRIVSDNRDAIESVRLGKARVYDCICGGRCIRPLHGSPKPCDRCDNDLASMTSVIEDMRMRISDMLKEARA
jgi:hypothetical protein